MTSWESMRITHPKSPHYSIVIPAPCWHLLCRISHLEGSSSISLFTWIIILTKPVQDVCLSFFSKFTSTCVSKPQWILTDGLMSLPGLWTSPGPADPISRSSTAPNPSNTGATGQDRGNECLSTTYYENSTVLGTLQIFNFSVTKHLL